MSGGKIKMFKDSMSERGVVVCRIFSHLLNDTMWQLIGIQQLQWIGEHLADYWSTVPSVSLSDWHIGCPLRREDPPECDGPTNRLAADWNKKGKKEVCPLTPWKELQSSPSPLDVPFQFLQPFHTELQLSNTYAPRTTPRTPGLEFWRDPLTLQCAQGHFAFFHAWLHGWPL